jgi:hypothetical protein
MSDERMLTRRIAEQAYGCDRAWKSTVSGFVLNGVNLARHVE